MPPPHSGICFIPTRCSKAPSCTRRSDTGAVLEFENEIEGIRINGVDIISFSADDRISHFKVMVRPLKAINLLHRLMGEQLARQ